MSGEIWADLGRSGQIWGDLHSTSRSAGRRVEGEDDVGVAKEQPTAHVGQVKQPHLLRIGAHGKLHLAAAAAAAAAALAHDVAHVGDLVIVADDGAAELERGCVEQQQVVVLRDAYSLGSISAQSRLSLG